jgi:hypothetical protein
VCQILVSCISVSEVLVFCGANVEFLGIRHGPPSIRYEVRSFLSNPSNVSTRVRRIFPLAVPAREARGDLCKAPP